VLILTLYPKENYATRAMNAGAAGFLGKDAAPEELISAVRQILSGKKYIKLFGKEN
jgi:DNA-binding NarL/FixJ family response regulator